MSMKTKEFMFNVMKDIAFNASEDPAARFSYFHSLVAIRKDFHKNIVSPVQPDYLDALTGMFSRGETRTRSRAMFSGALEFIGNTSDYTLGISSKVSQWWDLPEILEIVVFTDNGQRTFTL